MSLLDRRRSKLLLALGLLIAGVAVGSVWSLPGPVSARPVADPPPNGCGAAVSGAAVPDTVRVCDPSEVTLSAQPSCPVCAGGLKVAFIQREQATESRWQNTEAVDVLESLRQSYNGKMQAAVVIYGPGRARVAVRMTDELSVVRSALSRSTAVNNPPDHNNSASSAAREAVKQLKLTDEEEEGPPVCRMAVFFAQDSPTPG